MELLGEKEDQTGDLKKEEIYYPNGCQRSKKAEINGDANLPVDEIHSAIP